MTKIDKVVYECDNCGNEYDGESDYIKQCMICNKDYCNDCKEAHGVEEAFG